MAASGMRGVLGPMYRDARWYTANGYVVQYEWDEAAGRRAMDTALAVVTAAGKHPSGRLSGMVIPSQIDTCSEGLFRDSYAEALRLKVPFQTHAAQSIVEFHEMTRRHGMTPIEWLDSIGVLGPASIIGHGIFLDHHTATSWPKRDDLATIMDRGVTVAHCPTVFIRRGITMQTVGAYIKRGVKIGIGTDTYPHNMIEEMRHALYASRIVAKNVFDLRTSDIFNAATLGGAAALQRGDIGRLSPGAKADLVMVDVTAPSMRPLRDPIQSLIYAAADRAVRNVFVAGEQVVKDAVSPRWTTRRRALSLRKRSGAPNRWCASSTGRTARTRSFRRSSTNGTHKWLAAHPADRTDQRHGAVRRHAVRSARRSPRCPTAAKSRVIGSLKFHPGRSACRASYRRRFDCACRPSRLRATPARSGVQPAFFR
jgi:cytosine/adenosine deaminase-related metal-dependent hydrolase